jgi:uncharacterized membrane protein HdeD (DUF308 family)
MAVNIGNENIQEAIMFGGTFGVSGLIGGIITLGLGIIILIWPKLLTTLIGIWLIIVGIIAIINAF